MIKALSGKNLRICCNAAPNISPDCCRDFFGRRQELGDRFWKKLDEHLPECICESVAVSEHSPGPIADTETLVSVITNNRYVDQDGRVEHTLFDSRISNGISTNRKNYTSRCEHELRADKLVGNSPEKSNCGSILMSVNIIRSIRHNNRRAFGVYDTAQKENQSHAEIVATSVPPPGTHERQKN